MAFVIEGSVRAYLLGADGREVTLYRVRDGQGCVLSASCLLGGTPFPASAATEATTAGWAVPAAAFREWMDRHRYWRDYVFGLIGERLAAVLGRFEEVAFQRVDTRLARLLVSRAGADATGLRITQAQLADELGSAREVISRALGRWRAAGLVRPARGAIHILDRARLEQLAGTA
jgi:CRP/FNR family transcriptional regulator